MSEAPGLTLGVSRPRAAALIAGTEVAGLLSFSIHENEFSSPDEFTAAFALDALAAAAGASWFDGLERATEVEIRCGEVVNAQAFTAADLPSLFVGVLDDITTDWVDGVITVTGRDLTATLNDAKTSEKHINQTASAVAQALAAKHGLTAQVTATEGKVGALYKSDHVDLQSERTEWDLLTWLARESGFVVYVTGRTLYFGPRQTPAPFVISRTALRGEVERGNYVRLQTSRTLSVSGDIKVTVKSWNHKQKKGFTVTAKAAGAGKGAQEYAYSFPGLTKDAAQQRANQLLAELTQHARKLDYEGPAFPLKISDRVRVEGTGGGADALFYPDSIAREWSASEGYSLTLSAKNRPTEDQTQL